MMLTLGLPHHVEASALTDDSLPREYVEQMLLYGPGIVCNAWRLLPPEELKRTYGLLVFGRTLQGDDYGLDSAGRVWEIHVDEENALLSESLRPWLDSWFDGSAHESIRTPWFQPDGINWNESELHAVTAEDPTAVMSSLMTVLPDRVELSWIQSPSSVQAHIWWQAAPGSVPDDRVARGNAWICATAISTASSRAPWDLSLRVRTEGDADAVITELEPIVRRKGWLIT